MADELNNVVSINGKDYDGNTFSDEQKYVVQQLRSLQVKIDNAKFELDQLSAAQRVFTENLITSVEKADEPAEDVVEEAQVVN